METKVGGGGGAGIGPVSQTQVQVHWVLFCCGFLFFDIASQFSSIAPLCKRDFAEMNGSGHFHLSTSCPGSVTRVYLSN